MSELTHFNRRGEAQMVDVGAKAMTHRVAVAEGRIIVQPKTLELIRSGGHDKGDVLGIARVAGIMAAKQTGHLIPLCHPLTVTAVDVDLTIETEPAPAVHCRSRVACDGKTGVEMEALTAVHIALLTVYDMCKAVDRAMSMQGIRLVRKSGGQSGEWVRPGEVLSDE